MATRSKSVSGLERELVMSVINQLRIQANKRAVALRREARMAYKVPRRYNKLLAMSVEATQFATFIASLQDPDRHGFVGAGGGALIEEKSDG